MGALGFLEHYAENYSSKVNLLVAPCVSPWAYERINRWNYDAVDPNRDFRVDGPALESVALLQLVRSLDAQFLVHVDLHETTNSDETEFRPAVAARDGKVFTPAGIPDGFYLVDDKANPQPAFQQAVIAAVRQVTHIARADSRGNIIGSPVVADGVIEYALSDLRLCASITRALHHNHRSLSRQPTHNPGNLHPSPNHRCARGTRLCPSASMKPFHRQRAFASGR